MCIRGVEFLASYPVTSESNAKSYTINVSYEYEAMAGGKLMDNAFTSKWACLSP